MNAYRVHIQVSPASRNEMAYEQNWMDECRVDKTILAELVRKKEGSTPITPILNPYFSY